MTCARVGFVLGVLVLLAPSAASRSRASEPAGNDAAAMAARVDQLLAERWTAAGIEPAPLADDGEFLRRAYLDLCGTLPSVAEARAFFLDPAPGKRAQLVDRLLKDPDHATHLADTWRGFLLPADLDAAATLGFQHWLRARFVENLRYDNLVAELLVATGSVNQTGAALFYTAHETKPEELAAATSQIFLGVQIQCAQCHDHPFNDWKTGDFWGYAAFFARVGEQRLRGIGMQVVDLPSGEVRLPDSEEVVRPKYLDAREAQPWEDDSRRRQLAVWLVSRDNPYFAHATVNRVWAELFGRGLVEPVDDLGPHNPPSHPELLDELAAWFVESGFNLRELFRALALSRAYQLSSQASGSDDPPPELFARMAIKGLSAEQLYDAIGKATLRPLASGPAQPGVVEKLNDPARQQFVTNFRTLGSRRTEYQGGIPQALTLMNGGAVTLATDLEQSPLLVSLRAPFFRDAERVEVLFLATLSRPPDDEEREHFNAYVASGGARGDRWHALSDVLWALLNSAEFTLNH